jgi:hypothetical protein
LDPSSLLFFSVLTVALISPTEDARNSLLNGYMKQSGIEANLERFGRHYEQRVPDELKIYLGYAGYISKTITERKIVFQWRF